jgi:hypothetical protein
MLTSTKSGTWAHTLWKTMHDVQMSLSQKTGTINWLTFLRPEHLSGWCAQLCQFRENCVHSECQRSWSTFTKFIVSDYTRFADQGQKFLRYIVTRYKTEVNHTTLETKQAYMTLKHYRLCRQKNSKYHHQWGTLWQLLFGTIKSCFFGGGISLTVAVL